MRINEEDQRRAIAMSQLGIEINEFQTKHNLSTSEVISALAQWLSIAMKYVIREDRRDERQEITLDMATTALSRFVPDWHQQDDATTDEMITRMQLALKDAYYGLES